MEGDISKKDYMEFKFDSDYDLPLNKPLKFNVITIIIIVFEESGKLYPQVYWDGTWVMFKTAWIIKMLQSNKIDVVEEIDTNKTSLSR